MSKEIKDLSFEKAMEELEEIVNKLEEGGLSLEDSLDKFSRGIKLIKYCNEKLSETEEKIEVLIKEDDELQKIVPFEEEFGQ
ncbi:MAG: exodeoxyribonuclease VII small subunit [Halanaerobiales bacterium]|nr:exodeoxyribonuclease VII small subunit [Halanaerobiales bacterium]